MAETELKTFARFVRRRSAENCKAIGRLATAGLVGNVVGVLRQELDSMVRVLFLLHRPKKDRGALLAQAVAGKRWRHADGRLVTDREMVDLADRLHGWEASVYKFGCAFIHLSRCHDYAARDPFATLPRIEQEHILKHLRYYHGGPPEDARAFADIVPYLPRVFEKIASKELTRNSRCKYVFKRD